LLRTFKNVISNIGEMGEIGKMRNIGKMREIGEKTVSS